MAFSEKLLMAPVHDNGSMMDIGQSILDLWTGIYMDTKGHHINSHIEKS
jgi:hypothetical protein